MFIASVSIGLRMRAYKPSKIEVRFVHTLNYLEKMKGFDATFHCHIPSA